jgi:hypothetical protein
MKRSLILSTLLTATALQAQQGERHVLRGDDVAVYNLVGTLKVVGGSGSDAVAEVVRTGADARQLKVEVDDIRGRQTLRVIFPGDRISYRRENFGGRTELRVRDDGTFGGGEGGRRVTISDRGDGLEATANITLSVPKGKRVSIYLAVGEASVSNVDGELFLDVSSASITTEKTRGSLRLDTGSGEVRVTDAQGDVELDSGSGGVTLTRVTGQLINVDAGSGGFTGSELQVEELRLDLGSGRTRLSKVTAQDVTIDAGSGGVDVELTGDIRSLVIDAGSGGVTLRVPSTLGAQLDVDTGSGGIDADIPLTITRQSRDRIVGTIGDGKGRIRISTGSGGVRLLRS